MMFQHNFAYMFNSFIFLIKYYCNDKYFTKNNQNSARGSIKGNKFVLIFNESLEKNNSVNGHSTF